RCGAIFFSWAAESRRLCCFSFSLQRTMDGQCGTQSARDRHRFRDRRRKLMKRWGLYLSVAAVLAYALAVEPEAMGQKKKGPATHSMTGCLQKGEGNMFTLTNVEGTGPKTVEIVGTAPGVNLSPHVGHKVEITGTAVSA